MAAPDTGKIETGPWKVTFGAADLGDVTPEGITLNIEKRSRERMVDRFGENLIERIDLGDRVEITLQMMEYVEENLAIALPEAYDGSSYVSLGRRPGFKFTGVAGELILRPHANVAGAVATSDITISKAVCTGSLSIPMSAAADRVFAVTFEAYLDPTGTELARLMSWKLPAR